MSALKQHNISRIILLPGQNEQKIRNRFSWGEGLEIEYVSEENPSGTAAALQKLEEKVGKTFLA
ncbi:hypothetical protein HRED_08925, partial [Candidatus Haloredivivus sp. G17]